MGIYDTGYGQRGMIWSLGPGYYAVENGAGGATLYGYDKNDYPRSSKKIRDLNPEEFQTILKQNQNRVRRMKSKTLLQKLDESLMLDHVDGFDEMLETAQSGLRRFDTVQQLKSHLHEGALLNITKLGSYALKIPYGEYMVWMTDSGHTMLVPTNKNGSPSGVYEATEDKYDVLTPALLQHFNSVERVLEEEAQDQNPFEGGETEDDSGESQPAQQFKSYINPNDIDRHEILRAMRRKGMSETQLAAAVGVDTPMISRILRTEGPSARDPSYELACKLSDVLGVPLDIFRKGEKMREQTKPATRTSGAGGPGARQKGRAWRANKKQHNVPVGQMGGTATESKRNKRKALTEGATGFLTDFVRQNNIQYEPIGTKGAIRVQSQDPALYHMADYKVSSVVSGGGVIMVPITPPDQEEWNRGMEEMPGPEDSRWAENQDRDAYMNSEWPPGAPVYR